MKISTNPRIEIAISGADEGYICKYSESCFTCPLPDCVININIQKTNMTAYERKVTNERTNYNRV